MEKKRQGKFVMEAVKSNWMQLLLVIVTILSVISTGALWALHAELKPLQQAIEANQKNICDLTERLERYRSEHATHASIPGHPVMEERVAHVSTSLDTIGTTVDKIEADVAKILGKITSNM